jgi:hypothetical protein
MAFWKSPSEIVVAAIGDRFAEREIKIPPKASTANIFIAAKAKSPPTEPVTGSEWPLPPIVYPDVVAGGGRAAPVGLGRFLVGPMV